MVIIRRQLHVVLPRSESGRSRLSFMKSFDSLSCAFYRRQMLKQTGDHIDRKLRLADEFLDDRLPLAEVSTFMYSGIRRPFHRFWASFTSGSAAMLPRCQPVTARASTLSSFSVGAPCEGRVDTARRR